MQRHGDLVAKCEVVADINNEEENNQRQILSGKKNQINIHEIQILKICTKLWNKSLINICWPEKKYQLVTVLLTMKL